MVMSNSVSTVILSTLSMLVVSCNTPAYMHATTPDAPAVVRADAFEIDSRACVAVQNYSQAINYCRQQLNAVNPSFSIIVSGDNVAGDMSAIAQDMLDSGLAVAMSMESTGKRITFTPEYSDCVLMLKAHRDPEFRAKLTPRTLNALLKAELIVAQVCEQHASSYDRAVALHDYIALQTRYDSRLGIAAQADATTRLLLEGRAVCDGYAHAYGLMLSIAGIENRFVVGTGDDVDHIWNLVRLDGVWTHVDVTYDDPKPDKVGRIMHSYFGMSDSRISANHKWKRSEFPRAASDALYHPFRKGHRFSTVRDMLLWANAQMVGSPWNVTVYVDELERFRSESAAHEKVQSVADIVGADALRSIAIDPGCRGALYCSFDK